MIRRLPVAPSLTPLEGYATRFQDLFGARAQRECFRRYLEGFFPAHPYFRRPGGMHYDLEQDFYQCPVGKAKS
jgi:hypothetical protein